MSRSLIAYCFHSFSLIPLSQGSRRAGLISLTQSTLITASLNPRPGSAGENHQPTYTGTSGNTPQHASLSTCTGTSGNTPQPVHLSTCTGTSGNTPQPVRLSTCTGTSGNTPQPVRLSTCTGTSGNTPQPVPSLSVCPHAQGPQAEVSPRCGRLLGFTSGSDNPHGVRAVTRGQRCALALWFTLQETQADQVCERE
ncbi:UNVERIFIED_CONTAM: hypothetical protein FKN15_025628 [Acipenser sinensis]